MATKRFRVSLVLMIAWLVSMLVALEVGSIFRPLEPRPASAESQGQESQSLRQSQLMQDDFVRLMREIRRELSGIRQCLCEQE